MAIVRLAAVSKYGVSYFHFLVPSYLRSNSTKVLVTGESVLVGLVN